MIRYKNKSVKGLFLALFLGVTSSLYAGITPEFIGGETALNNYIEAAKQYPDSLPKSGVDSVTATFVVEKTGHITNVSVTGTKIKSVAREVRRLVENMPDWIPAETEGIKTRSYTSIKVGYNYSLSNKERQNARPKNYVFQDSIIDDYHRVLNKLGKWNFLYRNGTDILPYNYEHLYHYPDGTVKACHNGKFGLVNCNNEEILPYEYDELYYYESGYIRAKKDGRWGLISATGKSIVPCRYDTIGLFGLDSSFGDKFDEDFLPGKIIMRDLAYVRLGGRCGFINVKGKEEIPISASAMYPFTIGYAVFEQNGKMGLYNDLGKIVVSARYDGMKYFHSNLALVKNNNHYGLADELGQSVMPCLFDTIFSFAASNDVIMVRKNGKYGLYDLTGMPLVECLWDSIYPNIEARNSIILTTGNVKEKQPLMFETAAKESNVTAESLARFEENGKWGFRLKSDSATWVVPLYDYVDDFYNGYSLVSVDGKWGMINMLGRVVVPVKYDYLNPFSDGYARFSKNGYMGFMNEKGEEVIKAVYRHVYPFVNGIAIVNKKLCIDTFGKNTNLPVEGLISEKGTKCIYVPGVVEKAFPDYLPPLKFPGDDCK